MYTPIPFPFFLCAVANGVQQAEKLMEKLDKMHAGNKRQKLSRVPRTAAGPVPEGVPAWARK